MCVGVLLDRYNTVAMLLNECAKGQTDESDALYQIAQRNQRNTSVRIRFGVYDLGGSGEDAGGVATRHKNKKRPSVKAGAGGAGRKVTFSCLYCGAETKGESPQCPSCPVLVSDLANVVA